MKRDEYLHFNNCKDLQILYAWTSLTYTVHITRDSSQNETRFVLRTV